VPDDFKPGECYDCTNGAKCPFAARGCWAGAKEFEKCPLKEARIAKSVDAGNDGEIFEAPINELTRRLEDTGERIELYAVEVKKTGGKMKPYIIKVPDCMTPENFCAHSVQEREILIAAFKDATLMILGMDAGEEEKPKAKEAKE